MLWSDFQPYVLPHVIGVPQPTMELHARLAAIEFCRRTTCDIRTLAAVETDGTADVALVAPTDTRIIKIKAVEVDGKEWTLVDATHGKSSSRRQLSGDYAFTQDGINLQLFPVPVTGIEVVADVALAPSMGSVELFDPIGEQYVQDIAHGVIAGIKSIPGQPFSDSPGADQARAMFQARINTVSAKMSRGLMGLKMRSHVGYL